MYPNILMVEDDRKMRIVIKCILLRIGFFADQIYDAVNGKEGLEILRQYDIDLILTGINMPVMGWTGNVGTYIFGRIPVLRKSLRL